MGAPSFSRRGGGGGGAIVGMWAGRGGEAHECRDTETGLKNFNRHLLQGVLGGGGGGHGPPPYMGGHDYKFAKHKTHNHTQNSILLTQHTK